MLRLALLASAVVDGTVDTFGAGGRCGVELELLPGADGDGSLRRVRDLEEGGLRGYLHVPRDEHRNGEALPLLLFLHGAGESGDRLEKLISPGATGPMRNLSRHEAIPDLQDRFVVAAPQAPRAREGFPMDKVLRFTDALLSSQGLGMTLDQRRVYITGHSMGGFGAISAAKSRRYAAVAPVAPAARADHAAKHAVALEDVPFWALHGKNDIVIGHKVSVNLVTELRRRGVSEDLARLTIFEDAPPPPGDPHQIGHGSTSLAYDMPELFEWFLAQRLSDEWILGDCC